MVYKNNKKPHSTDSLATEVEQGSDKSRFDLRLERYARAKDIASGNYQYIKNNVPQSNMIRKKSIRLRECGSYLIFHDYYTLGEIKLAYASMCDYSLLCPLCAIRRGAKLVAKYLDRYKSIMASESVLRPYMVTLTVKDGDNLINRFNHLQSSVKRYHKGRHRVHTSCEAKKAHSAVWSYEVKRGKNSRSWHPHVHAVWLCQDKPDPFKLSQEWKEITGDSYIVDVTPIDVSEPESGFLEVFKYALKFSEQTPADTYHCFDTLSGRRLIGSFGGFRGLGSSVEFTDELYDSLPFIEMFFKYSGHQYRRYSRDDF